MKHAGLDLTVEGDISDFLGVNIQRHEDGTVHLTQPYLIDSILEELGLQGANIKPVACSKLLSSDKDSTAFDKHFHYRFIIGKLNYLEKSTQDQTWHVHT